MIRTSDVANGRDIGTFYQPRRTVRDEGRYASQVDAAEIAKGIGTHRSNPPWTPALGPDGDDFDLRRSPPQLWDV